MKDSRESSQAMRHSSGANNNNNNKSNYNDMDNKKNDNDNNTNNNNNKVATIPHVLELSLRSSYVLSDKAPTNKIYRRASNQQRPRTRSCHESERLV